RRERTGAERKGMDVKIDGEDAISAEEERRLRPRTVGQGSGSERDEQQANGSLHKPNLDASTCAPEENRNNERPAVHTMARSIMRSRTATIRLRREKVRKKPK